MSMPLDFMQLGFFTYGFMGSIYTATAGWSFGLVALWWFTLAYLAVHREDPEPIRADFHTWWLISMGSGIVLGFFLLWSLRLDRLIDTEFLNYRNAKRYLSLEFFWVIFFTTMTYAGFYYDTGNFSNGFGLVPYRTAQTVGITLLVVGGLGIVTTFVWMFANSTDRRESTLNAKYILALALGIFAAPAAYEYSWTGGLQPWHGLIALAAILVYWILMIFWIGFTNVNADGKFKAVNWIAHSEEGATPYAVDLKNHASDRFYSPRQGAFFIGFGFMSQFIVYLVGWGVDTHFKAAEPTDMEPVVAAIAITSLVLSILLVILHYAGRNTWWPSAPERNAVQDYDTHVKGRLQKQV